MSWRVNTRASHPESRHADHDWHSQWHGEDSAPTRNPMEHRINRIPRNRGLSRAVFAFTLVGFTLVAALAATAFAYAIRGMV